MPTTAIAYEKDGVIVSAETNYQGFEYDPTCKICTPTNKRTIRKWDALEDIFPHLVDGKSVIDLGANFGFLCFKAVEHGAKWAVAVERHDAYLDPMRKLCRKLLISRDVSWAKVRFPGETAHMFADVVICLSLLHHVFPKHDLESILDSLCAMTNETAIVEWMTREDRAIIRKGWASAHPEYNEDRFVELAEERFGLVSYLAHGHHDTRHIYLLQKGIQ